MQAGGYRRVTWKANATMTSLDRPQLQQQNATANWKLDRPEIVVYAPHDYLASVVAVVAISSSSISSSSSSTALLIVAGIIYMREGNEARRRGIPADPKIFR